MRNEYDANRALAAHRLSHAERCLRPRPLVQRMAEHEARQRAERRAYIAALTAIMLGCLFCAAVLVAALMEVA